MPTWLQALQGWTQVMTGHMCNTKLASNINYLQVQILDLLPRPNPQNESFGVTTAFSIGWWNRTGYSTPGYAPGRNGAVVYKVQLSILRLVLLVK